jgi:hypothetical protein
MSHLMPLLMLLPLIAYSQSIITIDGRFDDWQNVATIVNDPPNDEHDTDWYSDHLSEPVGRKYSDIDLLQVKFTHDRENLYGYVKSRGVIGRTATSADGLKAGRFYFIITIDVDNEDSTGYPLQEGNYWPNSTGFDMNMEVEFYDGSFNTGHYILHAYRGETELAQGRMELEKHMIRLAPGNYDDYLQWVVFPDSTFTYVSDRGPIIENGIIKVAVSPDGHEAEMKAPMWGFYRNINGDPVMKPGNTIDISFSLEGSGELSEGALELGYAGKKSLWGSDTAEPIIGYFLSDATASIAEKQNKLELFQLQQNFPNPFNSSTLLGYHLAKSSNVHLAVFDLLGHQIAVLKSGFVQSGDHTHVWEGVDEYGSALPGGVYFIRLEAQNQLRVIKTILVR